MKLSIGMMVKNESKYLRACLESLKPIRDAIESELIIVDTGSTDNTVEIAKEFTDKVYFHQWNSDFSEIRNVTIKYSIGEWFLVIDGDEVINNPSGIIDFFNSAEIKKYKTACVSVKNFSSIGNEENFTVFTSTRIFKKDKEFCFEGAVHNQPIWKKPMILLDSEILHYGYITDDKELMDKKFLRTSEILKNELKKKPEYIYYIYQLAVSYAMHGDRLEALETIEKAYDIVKLKNLNLNEYMYVSSFLARMYSANRKFREVEKICLEATKIEGFYIDLYFYLAKAQFLNYKNEQAIETYNIYLKKLEDYENFKVADDITMINYTLDRYDDACSDMACLYERMGKYEEALKFIKKIKSDKVLKNVFNISISLYVKLNKFEDLRFFYNDITTNHNFIKDYFFTALELYLLKVDKKIKNNIFKVFTEGDTEYALLNKVRLTSDNTYRKFDKDIDNLDFSVLPDYFSDILYCFLCEKKSLVKYLEGVNDFKIKNYCNYLVLRHEDFGMNLYDYLKNYENTELSLDGIRIYKILAIYFFQGENISNEKYSEILDRYLEVGEEYLFRIYNQKIIQGELIYCLKDEEDLFLMYMYLANKNKNSTAIYIKYLRKALSVCNYMKTGIDILSERVNEGLKQKDNEMEIYRTEVKKAITQLIEKNSLEEATILIDEYEEIIKDDTEIYSMKAVVAIIEENFIKAEKILKDGLMMDNNNFDLYYNLGYLYDNQNRTIEALAAYTIAKMLCKDDNISNLMEENILRISKKETNGYNVIFYGTLEECKKLEQVFNEYNVIGYIVYGNNYTRDEKILSIKKIGTYNYDFILIVDENNEKMYLTQLRKHGVDKNIYLYSDFKMSVIEGFDYRIRELLCDNNIEMLITGSSYAEVGIRTEQLNTKAINFAFSSQDLFYDYEIVNYLLNFDNIKNSIKYVILGFSYNYFDYDMSKSIAKYRIQRYTSYINNSHNNNDAIGVNVTKKLYKNRLGFKEYNEMNKIKENTILRYKDEEQEYIAQKNSSMNYDVTRKENMGILFEYLNLLKKNGIKPIIVICPKSKYYNEFFNDGYQKNKFYKIMDDFKTKFDFQIIDYSNSDLFDDNDFWDYGHLNGKGSNKFTKILNREIKW
ncbi:glycosyltransferase [Clostridium estertheticum]|uniref:glycosyltransferase n=1 Tax=Clostridium estertheticum TaxID=238834 RepID=UPI001C7D9AFD|nr:glycosyltransferase [Clostridium estertheticum]MBX4262479.1 glycosyltransferase [Clostridium estertheticum]WLC68908.1 glycosyltransferase [Clostridium estertheticum]